MRRHEVVASSYILGRRLRVYHGSLSMNEFLMSKANPQVAGSRRFLFCRDGSHNVSSRCLSYAEINIFRSRRAGIAMRLGDHLSIARLKDVYARCDKCAVNLNHTYKCPVTC